MHAMFSGSIMTFRWFSKYIFWCFLIDIKYARVLKITESRWWVHCRLALYSFTFFYMHEIFLNKV